MRNIIVMLGLLGGSTASRVNVGREGAARVALLFRTLRSRISCPGLNAR